MKEAEEIPEGGFGIESMPDLNRPTPYVFYRTDGYCK
jgi:hypothetical protein